MPFFDGNIIQSHEFEGPGRDIKGRSCRSSRCHSDGAVKADHLTVEHRITDDTLDKLRIFRRPAETGGRSDEHTSELQSLMRRSYAVFCLQKKRHNAHTSERTHIKRIYSTHLTFTSQTTHRTKHKSQHHMIQSQQQNQPT